MNKILSILIIPSLLFNCNDQTADISGEWYSEKCKGMFARLVIEQDGQICKLQTTFDKNKNGEIDEVHRTDWNGRSYTGMLEGNTITIAQSIGSKELLYSSDSETIYFIDCEWKRKSTN